MTIGICPRPKGGGPLPVRPTYCRCLLLGGEDAVTELEELDRVLVGIVEEKRSGAEVERVVVRRAPAGSHGVYV